MISLQSLSQEFLPNLYIKNVTLDSNYETSNLDDENFSIPSSTGNSRVMLSAKFAKNSSLMSDLALLLDSELNQNFKIYVHQITNKNFFDQFLTVGGGINSIYDSSGKLTEEGKVLLTRDNSDEDFISTKIKTFSEVIINNNAAMQSIGLQQVLAASGAVVLPEEVLDDGTILSEIVFDLNFNIPKDVDFLAYVLVVGVNIEDNLQNPDNTTLYISNPKKEIVVLNGTLQSRGLIFTIAPFAAAEQNVQDLLKFGNPGDIWAGPVHEHQGTFMAGAVHSSDIPHPKLEYTIVPITKFVDNRIKDKIQKEQINITKAFESLNSLTSVYQGQANFLNFKEYMSKSYISEIYLTQDQDKNISGLFSIDKLKILKYNSAFTAIFQRAEQTLSSTQYETFISDVLSKAPLLQLRIYQGNRLLGSLTEGETSAFEAPDTAGNSFSIAVKDEILEQFIGFNDIQKIKTFVFKHEIESSSQSHYDYHVEVEYKDPTIQIIRDYYTTINQNTQKLSQVINHINMLNGFNPITQKINHSILQEIKESPEYSEQIKEIPITPNGLTTLRFEVFPPDMTIITNVLFGFIDPDVTAPAFISYFQNVTNLSTVTQDGLLVLQDFMINLTSKVENSLKIVGSKQAKDDFGAFGDYAKATNPLPGANEVPIAISIKGKPNRIRTYDYGYDFTGLIDSKPNLNPQLSKFFTGRSTSNFLLITKPDFVAACKYMFSRISSLGDNVDINSSIFNNALGTGFKPGPYPSQKPIQALYSHLNIPTTALRESVILPSNITTIRSGVSPDMNGKVTLAGIFKLNNFIIENNYFSLAKGTFGPQSMGMTLKEDLISILANGGTLIPSVSQSEYNNFFKGGLDLQATKKAENFIQVDETISAPLGAATEDIGLSEKNTKLGIFNDLGAEGNKFKVDPELKQETAKNNLDTTKNNLMNSLLMRQILTNVGKNNSFNLLKSNEVAYGSEGNNLSLENELILPNQVACLSANYLNSTGENPFKNFQIDQGYINNYVINPDLLSDYWFKHQNIVQVEYLSGFESYTEVDYLESKENPYIQGAEVETTEVNVKKPKWEMLTPEVLNANRDIFCRVVRYSGIGNYINSHLVRELEMPLINSYFIIK